MKAWLVLGLLALASAWAGGVDYACGQLALVATWAIAGLGLVLIVGQSGQISLGHGAALALGAYVEAACLARGLPVLVALPLAMTAGALFGVLASLPGRRLGGLGFGMSTLALALIVEEGLVRLDGLTGGSAGIAVPPLQFAGHSLEAPLAQALLSLTLLAIAMGLVRRVLASRIGRAWRALREDPQAAQAVGVDAEHFRALALLAGSALGALAGALYAHWLAWLSPEQFGLTLSFELLMLVFIGGVQRISGALWGAMVMVALPQVIALLREPLPPAVEALAGLDLLLFGTLLVALVLVRPGGLAGSRR